MADNAHTIGADNQPLIVRAYDAFRRALEADGYRGKPLPARNELLERERCAWYAAIAVAAVAVAKNQ